MEAPLKKVFWKDIRDRVDKVNPGFSALVDNLSPGSEHPLYLARYKYGESIIDKGRFLPPESPQKTSRVGIDDELQKNFSYSDGHIPASMMLKNTAELYINVGEKMFPWSLYSPGKLFAFWKKFDNKPSFHPSNIFHMSAGARFIFMIPNIADNRFHENLKKDYGVLAPPVTGLLSQWQVFKEIVHTETSPSDWSCEILLFSERWIKDIMQDPAWRDLYIYLLSDTWRSSSFRRNQIFYDLAMSFAQANRNLKPNPYLAGTLKHILALAVSSTPGFSPALDERSAPIKAIQKAYVESYRLGKYYPTIMQPTYYSPSKPCYYSLQLPTTLEFLPKSRKLSTTLFELCELKHITDIFLEEIQSGRLEIEDTAVAEIAKNLRVDFFNSKQDKYGQIRDAAEMPQEDGDLVQCFYRGEGSQFARSGTFVRGCVRISGT